MAKDIRGSKGGGGQQHTPVEYPNTLQSNATIHILDLISEGPIVGLVDGLKSVYLDETPVQNADGSYNFPNLVLTYRNGEPDQSVIPGYPAVENELGVGVELTSATAYTHQFTNLNMTALRVRLSTPALSYTNPQNGDISGYGVNYEIDISVDGGPYQLAVQSGFHGKTISKYERQHRINLPPATESWTVRVRRTTVNQTAGNYNDKTYIESLTEIVDGNFRYPYSALMGVQIDAKQFQNVPSRAYDVKGRIVQVPTNYDPETRIYTGIWDGTFKLAWTDNPVWCWYDMVCNERYGLGQLLGADHANRWSLYTIAKYCDGWVPTGKPVRSATVLSGAQTMSVNATTRVYTRSAGSFITDGFVVGDSVTFSGFANAANNTEGVIVGLTATTLTLSSTNDLVTEAAAAGRSVTLSRILEPRFTCNVFLQTQADAYKVIKDMASIFRGMMFWANGEIVGVTDMAVTPVYTYTPANVIDGRFTYHGTGRKARHTVALVTWNDPNQFGRAKVEYVDDQAGIAKYGIQQTDMMAIGCTSQSQAQRMGRYALLTAQYATQTVEFTVGLDGLLCAPGDIIRIADPLRAGVRLGGRVVSAASTTVVTLDAPVTAFVGDELTVIMPDGVAQTRTISAISGDSKTITVSSAFPSLPQPGAVWAIDRDDLETQRFRVLSIGESEPGKFGIMALQHNASIFDAVDFGTAIDEPNTIGSLNAAPTPPTTVTVDHHNSYGQVNTGTVLTVSWVPVNGAVRYYVEYQRDDNDWIRMEATSANSVDIRNVWAGTYRARVLAESVTGVQSNFTQSADHVVPDQTETPGFVDGLNADIANALATAENAQATADGAIDFFWQTSPPVIGSGAGQAKEGDFWVDTDNGNKLMRVTGGVWIDASDDEIGQALLAAQTAQSTADGKVKTWFGATAPTTPDVDATHGIGDLWYDTVTTKLKRWTGAGWTQDVADITYEQLAGSGINVMWDSYSRFNSAELYPTFAPTADTTLSFDNTIYINSGGSLKVQANSWTGDITGGQVYFGASITDYDTPLVGGKKYIFSGYFRPNAAGAKVRFAVRMSDGTYVSATADTNLGAANTWTRVSGVIDLTGVPSTVIGGLPYIYLNRQGATGSTYNVRVDRLMIEEKIGGLNTASTWSAGPSGIGVESALVAANNAQGTADAAAADAASSLNQLDAIGNDTIITVQEQKVIKANYVEVTNEQSGIDAEADRVVVSRTAYDNAIAALKTYLNGLGLVGAGPTYTWTGKTTNTTIVAATWQQKWQDVYYNRQTVLNSIAAKVNSQMQNGVIVPPAFGDELVINGSFESVVAGQASTGTHVVGTVLCDGWEIVEQTGNGAVMRCGVENSGSGARSGSRTLFIGALNAGTVVVPTGQSHYVIAAQKTKFSVTPGEQYLISGSITENGAQCEAGLSREMFFGLRFYDAAGAIVGTTSNCGFFYSGNFAATLPGAMNQFSDQKRAVTVPDTAVQARIIAYNNLYNLSGSNKNIVANQSHMRVDNFSIRRVVTPGVSPNMLSNSEFTYGASSWGNITAADVAKLADTYRVTIVKADDGTYTFPYQDVTYSIVTGNHYSASVEIGWGGTITANAYAQLDIQAWSAGFASNLGSVSSRQVFPGAGSGLGTTILTCNGLVLPANTAVLRFVLTFRGGCTWFFRKPKLERNVIAGPYMPGADAQYGSELTYAGSGRQIGDLRNVNPTGHANVGSAWISGSLTYSASAGTPATATISMSAGTLRLAGVDIAYNASSVGVTGTGGTTVDYLMYYDDPTYAGGTRTLGATTTYNTLINSTSRVYVGKITVVFPTSGSGGGGGDVKCVTTDMEVADGRLAGDINVGDTLLLCDPDTREEVEGVVTVAESHDVECVELRTDNGVVLRCSTTAPIPTDIGYLDAPQTLGRKVLTKIDGAIVEATVTTVIDIGIKTVRHITVGDRCFWSGLNGKLLHHNLKA